MSGLHNLKFYLKTPEKLDLSYSLEITYSETRAGLSYINNYPSQIYLPSHANYEWKTLKVLSISEHN